MIPNLQPARRRGPQFYNHKELNSSHSLTEFGSTLFPRTSREESSPVETLIITLKDPDQGTQLCPAFAKRATLVALKKKKIVVLSYSIMQ